MIKAYDICTNISNHRFSPNQDKIIKTALESGIKIIASGVDQKSILFNEENHQEMEFFYTAGLHPHYAKDWNNDLKKLIIKQLKNKDCVLAGETGLDYFRMLSSKQEQERSFREIIELSIEYNKPLLLHDRDSSEDFLKIIDNYPQMKGVVHCFSGDKDLVKEYVNRGLYIGYTGWITDLRRGKQALESIKSVPKDKILIETDAPFLTPWNNGKHPGRTVNMPENLFVLSKFIAEFLEISEIDFLKTTKQNTERLINLI